MKKENATGIIYQCGEEHIEERDEKKKRSVID